MKKTTFSFVIFLFFALNSHAQDVIFTQFYATPLQLNPAFAGNTIAPRLGLNYRDQWHNISNAYATYTASYDQFIEPLNSGIGLTLLGDVAGDGIYRKNEANISYAYRLQSNKGINMKIGIEVGVGQSNVDWDKLIFLDMIDPVNGSVNANASQEVPPQEFFNNYFNTSTGFLVYNKNWYVGLGLKHLNSPEQGVLENKTKLNSGLPLLYTVMSGYQIVLRTDNKKRVSSFVTPNLLIAKQGAFTQINLGAQVGLGSIFGGLGFRHAIGNSDAIITNFGVKKGIFKIGYSHDITINGLNRSFGAHEVSVVLNFDELYDRSKPNYLDCFKFFR